MCDEACDIRKSLAYLAGFDEGFEAGTKAEKLRAIEDDEYYEDDSGA